jgi:hypothetical protein
MKVTESTIKKIISEVVTEQLSEEFSVRKMRRIERFKMETGLTYQELMEDIIEQIDDITWLKVVEGLRKKYGYRV